jgi:predicted O-linked N-acetylglucosamine transferase (SPINDLY family)
MNQGQSSSQQVIRQAMQHQRSGEFEQAKTLYKKVLESAPRHADALHLYGLACHQQGDHKTAVSYIRRAVELVPDQPVLRNNLGDALRKAGDPEGALQQLRHALELRPDYAGAHQNLGAVHVELGDHDAALLHARETCRLKPDWAEAWFNLGLILLDHVLLEESIKAFRKALLIRPEYPVAATSLLYTLNLLPGADPARISEEHRKVAAGIFGAVRDTSAETRQNGRIRIGYVSSDFCAHAVNYFFEPVLEHHARAQFDTYCYSDVAHPDQVTRRLKRLARHWREITGWSDSAVCEQVKADRIDILVDLAGHTKHNRLGVFAAKPAGCQITYLGYPNTTGLDAMDYRIVDQYTVPVNETATGTERLVRLPRGFACFRPPEHAPPVQVAPVQNNGFVTLGSLHKLEKVNQDVIQVWARILQKNPGARLMLARDQLDDWHQKRLQALFLRQGIDSDRLEMIHLSNPHQSFFQLFSNIDVLLGAWLPACLICWG